MPSPINQDGFAVINFLSLSAAWLIRHIPKYVRPVMSCTGFLPCNTSLTCRIAGLVWSCLTVKLYCYTCVISVDWFQLLWGLLVPEARSMAKQHRPFLVVGNPFGNDSFLIILLALTGLAAPLSWFLEGMLYINFQNEWLNDVNKYKIIIVFLLKCSTFKPIHKHYIQATFIH